MGNRDRPKKQPKRKAKEKTHKAAAVVTHGLRTDDGGDHQAQAQATRRARRRVSSRATTPPTTKEHRPRMDATAAAPKTSTNGEKTTPATGERARAVDAAILQIEKQFGQGSIMRLGDTGARTAGGRRAHRVHRA